MLTVVVPHEEGERFRIDGYQFKPAETSRLKIVMQTADFTKALGQLNLFLHHGSMKRLDREQYWDKVDQLFRTSGKDVTSALLSVYKDEAPKVVGKSFTERAAEWADITRKVGPTIAAIFDASM